MNQINLILRVAGVLQNGLFSLRGMSSERYAFRSFGGHTSANLILADGTEGEAVALEDVNDDFTGEHVRAELEAWIRELEEANACTPGQAASARALLGG